MPKWIEESYLKDDLTDIRTCNNCKWCRPHILSNSFLDIMFFRKIKIDWDESRCHHEKSIIMGAKVNIDILSGEKREVKKVYGHCKSMRRIKEQCGIIGKLWEGKDE